MRENVGIIDVTPLGKLDLRGPDVPKLLNFLYVNKWSKLDIGAVRYGVMCDEDGVVLDDGVTGHLGPDHYFMSTTSSGAAAVYEWMENWLQTAFADWQVHVTPVTSAYASINVAGPKSRELLAPRRHGRRPLARGLSVHARANGHDRRDPRLPHVADRVHRRAELRDPRPCRLRPVRLGDPDGSKVATSGSAPFGLEAQRIMRLEKGHFIVGQDTDAVTQAFAAGLDWLVKLDKDDFAGKPELVWESGREGEPRLVGLQPIDPTVVPAEASQIVSGASKIEGRITSSRFSPTLGRSICLGIVSAPLAVPGTIVTVLLPDGRLVGGEGHGAPRALRSRGNPPPWLAPHPSRAARSARRRPPPCTPAGRCQGCDRRRRSVSPT